MTSRSTRLVWLHALIALGLLAAPGMLAQVGMDGERDGLLDELDPVGEASAAHEGDCSVPGATTGCAAHVICFVIELTGPSCTS